MDGASPIALEAWSMAWAFVCDTATVPYMCTFERSTLRRDGAEFSLFDTVMRLAAWWLGERDQNAIDTRKS